MKDLVGTLEKCKKQIWDISEKNIFYLTSRIFVQYVLQASTLGINKCEPKKNILVIVDLKA